MRLALAFTPEHLCLEACSVYSVGLFLWLLLAHASLANQKYIRVSSMLLWAPQETFPYDGYWETPLWIHLSGYIFKSTRVCKDQMNLLCSLSWWQEKSMNVDLHSSETPQYFCAYRSLSIRILGVRRWRNHQRSCWSRESLESCAEKTVDLVLRHKSGFKPLELPESLENKETSD